MLCQKPAKAGACFSKARIYLSAMGRHARAFLAAAAMLIVSYAHAAPRYTLPGPVVPDGLGVAAHFNTPLPGEMDKFAAAGLRFCRTDFGWENVERKPGVYDFSTYDPLVKTYADAGARPLFILDYTHHLYDDGLPPHTDAGRAAYARFAAASAAHFAGKGVIWELWNEPDYPIFWKPVPNPADYASMAIEAANAIHKADPTAIVVGPCTSGFKWDFFTIAFQHGLLDAIDAVSVHPYRSAPPESTAADYSRLRGLIGLYTSKGRTPLPIICSEWGYSSYDKGVTDQQQASLVLRQYLTNLEAGVDTTILYDWKDDGLDPHEREHHFGLLHNDLTPKPAYTAIAAFTKALNAYRFCHRIPSTDPADWDLVFAKGDQLAEVTWNAAPTASLAEQSPTVTQVAKGSADYARLLRVAEVEYSDAPISAGPENEPMLDVRVTNLGAKVAAVTVSLAGVTKADTNLQPGVAWPLRFDLGGDTPDPYATWSVQWNQRRLDELLEPGTSEADAVQVLCSAHGNNEAIQVDNLIGWPFRGALDRHPFAIEPHDWYIQSGSGAEYEDSVIYDSLCHFVPLTSPDLHPKSSGEYHIIFEEIQKEIYSRLLAGWPMSMTDATVWTSSTYHGGKLDSPASLTTLPAPPNGPGGVAVAWPYELADESRYIELCPSPSNTAIPFGARSLVIWIYADGNDEELYSRFKDRTGQIFEQYVCQMTWTGWKAVAIPLSAPNADYWSGANDGVVHPPCAWETMLLMTAGHHAPATGQILLAAPAYLMMDVR